ncbi:hypothetical protein EXIGLDRAFT_811967 [Exidia glandulosa HHB12029]|uniref:Uncharacterized protein n=1 Tax=Exidia glandulosa HHB12029 TaxID=1314781 RepID=A0A165C8S7_EXIGL|nr:hypothetical protein EXIGLDRAFT_811967 [Exidia glandulosa HHB12029]
MIGVQASSGSSFLTVTMASFHWTPPVNRLVYWAYWLVMSPKTPLSDGVLSVVIVVSDTSRATRNTRNDANGPRHRGADGYYVQQYRERNYCPVYICQPSTRQPAATEKRLHILPLPKLCSPGRSTRLRCLATINVAQPYEKADLSLANASVWRDGLSISGRGVCRARSCPLPTVPALHHITLARREEAPVMLFNCVDLGAECWCAPLACNGRLIHHACDESVRLGTNPYSQVSSYAPQRIMCWTSSVEHTRSRRRVRNVAREILALRGMRDGLSISVVRAHNPLGEPIMRWTSCTESLCSRRRVRIPTPGFAAKCVMIVDFGHWTRELDSSSSPPRVSVRDTLAIRPPSTVVGTRRAL